MPTLTMPGGDNVTIDLLTQVTTLVDAASTTVTWTDLDLSSYLLAGARHAWLQVRIREYLEGTEDLVGIRVGLRENGQSGAGYEQTVQAVAPPTGAGNMACVAVDSTVLVPVDASGICEYQIDYLNVEPATWYVDIVYLGSVAVT